MPLVRASGQSFDPLATSERARLETFERVVAAGIGLLTVAGMAALLFGSWSAFTNFKFTLTDYSKYVNMLWNTAHGRPFRVLADSSYLQTHLSFTLAPLGLVFYLWDHPFALAVVQWCVIGAGAVVLVLTARRAGWGAVECAALAFFTLLHPYTQSVVLSEFHGVMLYYLLVPWLLHDLLFHRSRVWIPLALLLGLREEAGFAVVPLILYMAVRERWRAGFAWALVALVYSTLATTWLFPALSGMALATRRDRLGVVAIVRSLVTDPWRGRVLAAFWLALPVTPFLVRGWRPLLVVPSVAAATVLLSPFVPQHTLSGHYPAQIVALTAAALVLTGRTSAARTVLRALALTILTLVAHLAMGFIPGGGRAASVYRESRPTGVAALRAAQTLSKDGLLVTDQDLAAFAANRLDLLSWRLYDPARHRAGLFFFTLRDLDRRPQGPILIDLLRRDAIGVDHFDGWFVTAHTGGAPAGNAAVLAAAGARSRTIMFAFARRRGGSEQFVPGGFIARYWPGHPKRTPLIARGDVRLPAGRYRAVLRYRTDGEGPVDGFGVLRLYREHSFEPMLEWPLARTDGPEFLESSRQFVLTAPSRVEARAWGGKGGVVLDRLVFEPEANR
jgi:uncharacterized membrane protein